MRAIAVLCCLLSIGLSGCSKKETEFEKRERIEKEERLRQETRDLLQFKALCQKHVTFIDSCSSLDSAYKTEALAEWVRSCATNPEERDKAIKCLKYMGDCRKYRYCWIDMSDAEIRMLDP